MLSDGSRVTGYNGQQVRLARRFWLLKKAHARKEKDRKTWEIIILLLILALPAAD